MYTGIILAGGKSSRMKTDKALLKLGETTLTQRVAGILKLFCNEILISTNRDDLNIIDCISIPDEIPELGPIGGIYTCLKQAKNEKSIILTCDTPFVSEELIKLLISNDLSAEITAFKKMEFMFPFPGIYDKKIIPKIEQMINVKNYKIQNLLKNTLSNIIEISESNEYIEQEFLNLNTQNDYQKAKEIYNERKN